VSTRPTRLSFAVLTVAIAIAACVAGAPVGAQVAPPQETASLQWGTTVAWIRVASTGAVNLYAANGYRTPFVHPAVLTADEVERWSALVERLVAAPHAPDTTARLTMAGGDVVVQVFPQGDSTGLVLRVGGTRPDGVNATVFAGAMPQLVSALHETLSVAREQAAHTAAVAAAAQAAAQAPTPAPAPVASQPSTVAQVPAAVQAAAVAPAPASAPMLAAVSTPVAPAAPATPAPAPTAPAPAAAAAKTTANPASAGTKHRAPRAAPAATTPAAPAAAPTPAPAAGSGATSMRRVTPPTVPVVPVASRTSPPAAQPTLTTEAAAGTVATTGTDRVNESTIGNLVRQWEPQLQLCYTDYGLKQNHDLAGTVTVRVAIRSTGEVAAVEIPQRHWSSPTAVPAVESCVKNRVKSWLFPAASLGSTHDFRLIFTQ
jgi:hypothetical protein